MRKDLTHVNSRKTFRSWLSNGRTVRRGDLARSGFFYLGNLDRVQCFSCGGVLRSWNYEDNVDREHRIYFSNCRMVRHKEERNKPLPASCVAPGDDDKNNDIFGLELATVSLINHKELVRRLDLHHDSENRMVRGTESQNVSLPSRERPSVSIPELMLEAPDPSNAEQERLRNKFPCLTPASTHMRNENARFETFDNRWPAIEVRATPRQISRAGFFFLGERDRVKCWYCNGGLQNWDPDDEPWTEHAKWFPTCEFLLSRKGHKFVNRIVNKFPHLRRPILQNPFKDSSPEWLNGKTPAEKQRTKFSDNTLTGAIKNLRSLERQRRVFPFNNTSKFLVNYDDFEEKHLSGNSKGSDSPHDFFAKSLNKRIIDNTPSVMTTHVRKQDGERKCKLCLDRLADAVFFPCGHQCCCSYCSKLLLDCPICEQLVQRVLKSKA